MERGVEAAAPSPNAALRFLHPYPSSRCRGSPAPNGWAARCLSTCASRSGRVPLVVAAEAQAAIRRRNKKEREKQATKVPALLSSGIK